MRSLARYLAALFAVLTLGASMNAMAAVTASLDRNQIAPDETVQLLLQRDGSSNGQPDLGKLKRDFDTIATSRGSAPSANRWAACATSPVFLIGRRCGST